MKPLDAYGENPLAIWLHDLRDRLHGRHARANARRGFLRAPEGGGRVVWIQAGGDAQSVLLAAELMAALRERRLDIRLVLTFEAEYPDLIKPRLRGTKIGFGYGPAAGAAALARTLARLDPLGVLCVGRTPPRHLLRLAQARGSHLVVVDGTPPPADGAAGIDAAYPSDSAQADAWEGRAAYVAPVSDPLTILTPAQVEPTFGALVRGGQLVHLYWVHGGLAHVRAALAAWSDSPLRARSIVFASVEEGPWPDAPPGLEGWDRRAVAAGSVLHVNAPRWLPAVAASAEAVYLEGGGRAALWQALAGAAPVVLAGGVQDAAARAGAELPQADPHGFFALAEQWAEAPQRARPLADAARRAFWQARRTATQTVEELLQRVYDW